MFAWRDAVATATRRTGNALNGIATVSAWSALGGGDAPSGGAGAGTARLRRALRTRAFWPAPSRSPWRR